MKKLVVLFVLFLIGRSAGPSYAQDLTDREPPEWGEIPQEHLAMDTYAPDSNAAVVILSDYGNLFFEDDLDMVFERHTRIQASDGGYSALENRRALKEADTPEAFVQETLLDGLDGALVDSCSVTNQETITEQLKLEAAFAAPAYAQVAGDFIYFNPTPLGRLGENPLRLPERTFPVDLAYPRQQINTFQLKLPEGYVVQETPRNVRLLLPEGSGMYQRLLQVQGGVLSVQSQFVIKQSIFEPERYEQLRSFFEQVVAAEAEQVVLHRE